MLRGCGVLNRSQRQTIDCARCEGGAVAVNCFVEGVLSSSTDGKCLTSGINLSFNHSRPISIVRIVSGRNPGNHVPCNLLMLCLLEPSFNFTRPATTHVPFIRNLSTFCYLQLFHHIQNKPRAICTRTSSFKVYTIPVEH